MNGLILNACLTGMVTSKERNPHVPISPGEIVRDALAVGRAGAQIVHIHARGAEGLPTWEPAVYREIIDGIRAEAPELVICASTSGRLWSEREKRAAVLMLERGPDMGSLTLGSMNFSRQASVNPPEDILYLLDLMNERGIKPEIEIFDLGMVDFLGRLVAEGRVKKPIYANILLGNRGTADATELNLRFMVSRLPAGCVWAACGIGKHQLPMNRLAVAMGGHVRVGLEDNLYMDTASKEPATNLALMQRVVAAAREMGREPMGKADARAAVL
ncbi:MAG: 3-keto-5-aminohexanoate cleavage protein [Chthoniobacteraceae bacterium]|jgi:uncharacterized protein (DUF849 family)